MDQGDQLANLLMHQPPLIMTYFQNIFHQRKHEYANKISQFRDIYIFQNYHLPAKNVKKQSIRKIIEIVTKY